MMRRARLLAALGLVALATVVVGPADAASGCGNDTYDRWNAVPLPVGHGSLAQIDTGACALVATTPDAVLRSPDGGRSWVVAARALVTGPVWAEGLGSTVVVPYTERGTTGLLVSTDGGVTYDRRPAPDPDVVLVAGARTPSGPALYALVPGGPVGVYRSADSGATWAPMPGSAVVVEPRVFAAGPAGDGTFWLTGSALGGAAGAVFHATADGLVAPIRSGAIGPIVADHYLADMGETVLVATDDGLLRSSDGGVSWTTLLADRVTDLRTDPGRVNAIVAVHDHLVWRSATNGVQWRSWSADGLPADCEPTGLARTSTLPPAYVVRCGSRAYLRPTSGYDLVGTDFYRPDPPPDLPESTPMPVVGTPIQLSGENTSDGSIAFDGRILYWSDGSGSIYRMVTATRQELDPLEVDWSAASLAADPIRQILYVYEPRTGEMRGVDLATGRSRVLFTVDGVGWVASWSWDWQRDAFYAIEESGSQIYRLDLTGRGTKVCKAQVQHVDESAGFKYASAAAYVAIGGGLGLVESESDEDMIRIDENCHVLARLKHRMYAEAEKENDSIACDGVTFGQPVVWLRDAALNVATAYAAPGAYCPVPTTMDVTAPVRVAGGRAVDVCGTLRLRVDGSPIGGQRVALLAHGRRIADATTDGNGRVCGRDESGGAARRVPVEALFLGSSAYLSSSARGTYDVLPAPRPAPRPEIEGVAPVWPRPPVAALGLAEPPPPLQVNPNPVPNPNVNPNAHPQALPQGAAGYARQAEPRPMLARVEGNDEEVVFEMSARDRGAAAALLAAGSVMSAVAVVARRRQSRTGYARQGVR